MLDMLSFEVKLILRVSSPLSEVNISSDGNDMIIYNDAQ